MKNIFIIFILILFSCEKKTEEKVVKNPGTNHQMDNNELHLSDQQIQLGNISTDSLTEHVLGEEFLVTGIINVNENKTTVMSSRMMGRIEKLYIKNAGDRVLKGEPLYEIYSEDLSLAIREYLLSSEKSKFLKNDAVDIEKIIRSSINKLKLFGLSDEQINNFSAIQNLSNSIKILSPVSGIITAVDKKEGDYVMEGSNIFHLADLSSLWVEGQVYADYLKNIKESLSAQITFPGFPGKEISGKTSFIYPEFNPSSKINAIRIEIPNDKMELQPGMHAYINVLTNQTTALALPTKAVIIEEKGSTVWIKTGHNQFKSVMVTTGVEGGGFTEIKSGLSKGDIVVITGAYLLNSEFIFKKGTNPMEGHNMSEM